jgi:hypothetical protein
MSMNVPFAGSHVRPVKAELSGDGGSIEVTVHNHDRAGLDDRAGVTLVAPNGATQSVPAVFDQYLPPTGQGGGASLGSDMWRANIPVSSLSPAMRGVSPLQLRVRAFVDEGTNHVESGSSVAVAGSTQPANVALPAPDNAFGNSSEFRARYQAESSTALGQVSTTILPQDTSAQTYKNRSTQHFVKEIALQPTAEASSRLNGVSEIAAVLLPIFQRVDKHGTDHPQTAQPFVNYPYRADELAIHVTLRKQGDGSFRAEAPSGEAFAKLTSTGGYFTNSDDSLSGFAVSYPSAPGPEEKVASTDR